MDRDAVRTLPFWRRRAAAAAAVAIVAAAPFAVFHATIKDAATDFRLELGYLVSGWGPWLLIVVGSLCFVPVVVSLGRSAFSRWALAPGIRLSYEIWGAVLYLLGLGLLVQTAQVAAVF